MQINNVDTGKMSVAFLLDKGIKAKGGFLFPYQKINLT